MENLPRAGFVTGLIGLSALHTRTGQQDIPRLCVLAARHLRLVTAGCVFTMLAFAGSAFAVPHVPAYSSKAIEQPIAELLQSLAEGDLHQALMQSEQLLEQFPGYRLGQLLQAEILNAFATGEMLLTSDQAWPEELLHLQLEANWRFQQAALPVSRSVTNQDSQTLTTATTPVARLGHNFEHLVVVNLVQSTLHLFANRFDGRLDPIASHYVSSGSGGAGKWAEGDLKTPIGVYRMTGFRDDRDLPELYGAGAFMLDYPNSIDRIEGRRGSGIWLHGTPTGVLARAPYSSEGCVVMPNDLVRSLHRRIDPERTLVILQHYEDPLHANWQTFPAFGSDKQEDTGSIKLGRKKTGQTSDQIRNLLHRYLSEHHPTLATAEQIIESGDLTVLDYPANNGKLSGPETKHRLMMLFPLPAKESASRQHSPDSHADKPLWVTLFWDYEPHSDDKFGNETVAINQWELVHALTEP